MQAGQAGTLGPSPPGFRQDFQGRSHRLLTVVPGRFVGLETRFTLGPLLLQILDFASQTFTLLFVHSILIAPGLDAVVQGGLLCFLGHVLLLQSRQLGR